MAKNGRKKGHLAVLFIFTQTIDKSIHKENHAFSDVCQAKIVQNTVSNINSVQLKRRQI